MSDDPLEALGQELRTQVAGEFRRAAEEEEFDARLVAMRNRTIPQVMFELMSRGDVVAVHVSGQVHSGVIAHARGTLATMETRAGYRLHLNVAAPFSITVAQKAIDGGKSFDKYGAESFIARLRQCELESTAIEILVSSRPHAVVGRLDIVAKDHVIVVGTVGETILPLVDILAVVERLA